MVISWQKLKKCVDNVRAASDAYDMPAATQAVSVFLEVLNNWYIRRNRGRFWGGERNEDKIQAYNTLYTVLHTMCRVVAPFLPQVSEAMFAGLVNGGNMDVAHSVHLANYPQELQTFEADEMLMQVMDKVQDICNTAHAIRNEVGIRIRQPLANLTIFSENLDELFKKVSHLNKLIPQKGKHYFQALIEDETNVKEVQISFDFNAVATRKLKIHFPVVGKRLPVKMKDIATAARTGGWSFTESGDVAICGEILTNGEF